MINARIIELVGPIAWKVPNKLALIGPDGQNLTYQQLYKSATKISESLSFLGVKVNQRVAVVMDNGIDMMLSFLAVSNIAAFVPLSPDYSAEQYRYYFQILKIDYLLVPAGYVSDCIKVSEELNTPVFYLEKQCDIEEGNYEVTGNIKANHSYSSLPAKNEDIAMVLFTSGTTSFPKIVPRSQNNIYWSAQKRMQEMKLITNDRVLFTFPVFRGISLNDTLTVLASGGTVIYAERPEPERFFDLIEKTAPTWILGSPVLFHSLAEYAQKNHIKSSCSSLHCIRSSGAPLTEELAARLKQVFNVTIYVAFGLTETGNISSTQNSPEGIRKGSVGVPDNIEVGIMNENGDLQGCNIVGEIAVRGPQVIKAYDNEAAVNEAAFYGDWFKTGDSGYLDEDGYLYVIGRYKEIINRGGEKVSPYEIEAAISRHPDVLQVTVFPIPVGEGNEDVGAAVVLREGTELYLKDIRRFLNGKVTAFKMPSSLYVLTQMPASDAGKVQRKMLYEKIAAMGIPAQPLADANEPIIAPRNETEFKLYKIFRTILPVKEISVTDTFFELGGDSLKTVLLFNHIRRVFGTQIPVTYILNNSSIEDLAGYISKKQNNENIYNFVVPFNKEGTKTPLFFVHAADGTPAVCMNLAKDFDPDRPFYGFYFNHNAVEWKHPITFEQIAAEYIKDIRTIQPEGPYVINGHCLGGILAYEIAQQLSQAGQQIALLGMFDTIISKIQKEREEDAEGDNVQANNSTLMGYLRLKARKIKIYLMVDGSMFIYKITPNFMRSVIVKYLNREALLRYSRRRYEPKEYKGKMIYFKPEKSKASSIESIKLWQGINSKVEVIKLKGDHGSMFSVQNAWYTRDVLNNLLDKISNN